MHPSAQKVADAARELGLDLEIVAFAIAPERLVDVYGATAVSLKKSPYPHV